MRRTRSRSLNAGPVESWDNAGPRNSMCPADRKTRSLCERGSSRWLVHMGVTGTGGSPRCFSKKAGG